MSTTQFETSPIWQNYVDLNNDVKPWLQVPVGATTSDVLLQGVIDMACWWVQNYLGRPVAPTQFFRRFSGYTGLNGSMINLPYYPILRNPPISPCVVEYWGLNSGQVQTDSCTLTNSSANVLDANAVPAYVGATVTGTGVPASTTILSVVPGVSFTMSQNATASGTQTLSITTAGYILKEQTPSSQGAPGQQVFQCDYPHGILIRSFQGLIQRPFFPGLRNIEVTWTAGYDPVPADIRWATLQLIAHYWRQTQQASRTFPLPAGARQDEEYPMTGMYAGVPPEVERVLAQYIQVGIA